MVGQFPNIVSGDVLVSKMVFVWYFHTMKDTISMDKAGRLVVPKAIRERFHLQAGSQMKLQAVGDHLEVTPIRTQVQPEVEEDSGWVVIPGNQDIEITDAILSDREERDSLLEPES